MNTPRMLAQLYDAHHQQHIEDIPFWLELARLADGPVLELGCGTGRILLPMLEAGLPVVGLDLDWNMLAVLTEKNHTANQPSPVIQADMAAFHFNQLFSLIILPCNTFSTLEDAARISLLKLVVNHLSPGGIFAASLPNPRILSSLPHHADAEIEESFPLPSDGSLIQVSSAWEHDKESFMIFWYYDHISLSGSPKRYTATSTHKLVPATHYIAEFEAAGLSIVDQFGDFNRRPFTRRARSWIIIAQKPVPIVGDIRFIESSSTD